MFELDGVSKKFGQLQALDDITLSVPGGGTTVLIGPSGCGKSTLIRMMIGLVQPDQGRVSFAGSAVDRESAPGLRRRMGYVIQDGGLFPHLTAHQNVTLMARYLGNEPSGMAERLDEIRRLTHFPEDGLDRYPVQL
ncbi:MAG: ATP-binding cassette domain-containing protein, partial [Rhodospirillales bacterium]|nr:ATP-binding cassette domain-containing protein [Rhodospirillales bacterium]